MPSRKKYKGNSTIETYDEEGRLITTKFIDSDLFVALDAIYEVLLKILEEVKKKR